MQEEVWHHLTAEEESRLLLTSFERRGRDPDNAFRGGNWKLCVRERRKRRRRRREIGWERMDRKVCECAEQANRISFHVAVPSKLSKYYFILNCKGRKSVLTTF